MEVYSLPVTGGFLVFVSIIDTASVRVQHTPDGHMTTILFIVL